MQVVHSDHVVCFDIDGTLLIWDSKVEEGSYVIVDTPAGNKIKLKKNSKLINRLRQHYEQGHTVIAWSLAGKAWVEAAVKALEIEPYVHFAMSKPKLSYDDMGSGWMSVLNPHTFDSMENKE